MLRKNIFLLTLFAIPSTSLAATNVGKKNTPADHAVQSAVDAGKVFACDSSDGNCKRNNLQYSIFMSPDKTRAIAWVFGFPTDGTLNVGNFAEFKNNNGWKYVVTYQKPLVKYPAPTKNDVIFNGSHVKIKYHFHKDSDANCCSTGIGTVTLNLEG